VLNFFTSLNPGGTISISTIYQRSFLVIHRRGREVIHLHLGPRLGTSGAYPYSLYIHSGRWSLISFTSRHGV